MVFVVAVHEVHGTVERSIRDPLERFGREAEVAHLNERAIAREQRLRQHVRRAVDVTQEPDAPHPSIGQARKT